MERALASIQEIASVAPIPNADTLEKSKVLGWEIVTKKGEFRPGDQCVFFEIDSVLPAGEAWSEFLRERKFRVKTIKLRGQLSQGLALPVSILHLIEGEAIPTVGTNVTERLRVRKFEVPLPDDKNVSGPFYKGLPKTDEIRLQSAPEVLKEIANKDIYIATKLDGQSITYVRPLDGSPVVICTRNFSIYRGENNPTRVLDRYMLDERLPPGIAIQGELCGPGIQRNLLSLGEPDVFIFNVFSLHENKYMNVPHVSAMALTLGMKTVPFEEFRMAPDWDVAMWLDRAKGKYTSGAIKEGIVVRPVEETYSEFLKGRLSFKVINNDFLLRNEE
jgi:RNA ligase (TIGR02306 family)